MARARTPPSAWVEQGLEALAAGGPDAVRVELLAARLGVTKGGFYGYFTGRDHLLEAMLSAWETDVTDNVIAVVEAESAPRDRLRRLMQMVTDGGAATTRLATEVAIREWSRREPRAAEVVARVDERRTGYLRALFGEFCTPEDADERTAVAVSVRLASYFMSFGHPGRSHDDVVALVMRDLLR
ncbi:TetR/AcrR family transcriptional regulator [Nocardiopsis coralliicola]